MNAIILNALTGAVTEYARHNFHGITPTHGGGALGLFEFGGDTDAGLPIVAQVQLPTTLRDGDTRKTSIEGVYFSMQGSGEMQLDVAGPSSTLWSYKFPVRASGQSRCQVGRGIRENYMGFGLSNPDGQHFSLDQIEVLASKSKTRRV